jgi:hypothetical protein
LGPIGAKDEVRQHGTVDERPQPVGVSKTTRTSSPTPSKTTVTTDAIVPGSLEMMGA